VAYPQGIDFRQTSGFVTDPTNCDYEIGSAINYPRVTAQGNTVGWEDDPSVNQRDRNANVGDAAKLAGIVFGSSVLRYRFDLPSAGNYKVRIAAGDGAGANGVKVEVFDNVTSLGVLVSDRTTGVLTVDQFVDATDVVRTSTADWVSNNALSATLTFASTICRFKVFSALGGNYALSHLWVEAASGGGGGSGTGNLGLLGVGS
jgi:hypothetical protein